jgi:glycosyltransferase involved in cell wall biosynthesis
MQLMLPQSIRHNQPDLCHFPNNSASLSCAAPYIVTIHDASLFLYSQTHPRSRLLALRLLLPLVARRATAVITPSKQACQDLIHILKLPPDKVHVINGAAPDDFQPLTDPVQQDYLRQKYDLPPQFILYVGTIEPRKNLVRLVRAVRNLHQRGCHVPLFIVGPQGWKMNGVLEQEIKTMPEPELVRYLGYVAQADLPGIYSLATVFAFPSLYEGFGLPPLEAMSCGTAVLTSQASAMAEVCGDAAYLIDPYNEEDISDGLHQLLSDSAQRNNLQARGLQRASQFSWKRTAQETADLYQQVLSA